MKISKKRITLLCIIFTVSVLLAVLIFGGKFRVTRDERVLKCAGEKYELIGYEARFHHFGEEEFLGRVKGDLIKLPFAWLPDLVGVYAVGEDDSLLYRVDPLSEWYAYYRKSSLPRLDLSFENIDRLELVPYKEEDDDHSSCRKGITDKAEIDALLNDIRAQGAVDKRELYALVTKPDGFLGNCYLYGYLYGMFAEEPNLAIPMYITSYNDLAYSVEIDGKEYLLTEDHLEILIQANE